MGVKKRAKFWKSHSSKLGQSPGTLTFVGEQRQDKPVLRIISYDKDGLDEIDEGAVEDIALQEDRVIWVDVVGLHDPDLVSRLGARFSIHPLVLEDVLNTQHRPKIEELPEHLFLVVKNGTWTEAHTVALDQVTVVLGDQLVISFREREDGIFDGVRARLRGAKGRIRTRGADYLACALLDACVDRFYLVLDAANETVAELEDDLLAHPDSERLNAVHGLKSELNRLRRTIWPIREVTAELVRGDFDQIRDETDPFFRDVHDHVVHVAETVEILHDNLSGLMDLYLTGMSHRMNEVMKVLTVIASLFIPLTFIVGVYGMNFQYMPELGWTWSYPVLWIIMVGLAVALLVVFKRKDWF